MGLRLSWLNDGTGRLDYHTIYIVLIEAHEESPITRALHPEIYEFGGRWGLQEELLAGIYDQLSFARFEQHGQGKKPDLFPRPGRGHLGDKESGGRDTPKNSDGAIDWDSLPDHGFALYSGDSYEDDGDISLKGEMVHTRELIKMMNLEEYFETDKIVRDANKTLTGEEDGYKSSSMRTRRRYRSQVWADSPYARNSNSKHNTLMKMLMERDKGVPDVGDDE